MMPGGTEYDVVSSVYCISRCILLAKVTVISTVVCLELN